MNKKDLQDRLRLKILEIAMKTNSRHPHVGSCLSCIDILTQTLMFEMRQQDKFILSKGHASLALYVVLHDLGKISNKRLATYFQDGTEFGIHTPSTMPQEIPLATGSLGHGLSFSCGLALGIKMKKQDGKVYCLLSDGECEEGAVWEAALFASKHNLDNLIAIIDKNGLQAYGPIEQVLGDAATEEKWRSFGFNVITCDGHDMGKLGRAFGNMRKLKNKKPNMIIAKTIRGKGIESVEGKVESNYVTVDENIFKQALKKRANT